MSYVVNVNASQKRTIYFLLHFRLFHIDRLLSKPNLNDDSEYRLSREKEIIKRILENNSFSSINKNITFATVRRVGNEVK